MKKEKVWLQWQAFQGKAYPTLLYGELEDMPAIKRGKIGGPILLPQDESELPLTEIVKRHPAPALGG